MTAFDYCVLALVLFFAVIGLVRGIVRELIALAAWIAAVVLAFLFGNDVAALLPGLVDTPLAKQLIAFALIFVATLATGALLGYALAKAIRAIGLGVLDRLLGAMFGAAKGGAIALLFVLIAGVTTLPRSEWWQNSVLAPALATAALALRPWLPAAWAERLDYSRGGQRPARKGAAIAAAPKGEPERCAESWA